MFNEARVAVEREIYNLVASGEGKPAYPRLLRPIFGNDFKFVLPTDVSLWWLHKVPVTLQNFSVTCEIQESFITVGSNYFQNRRLPLKWDPLNIFGVNPSVHIGIETSLRREPPTGVFYNLYLPRESEGYHTLNVVPSREHIRDLGDVQPQQLTAMLEYLKSAQPIK